MARRSATNPRYGKDTAPAGKTRRSAASAKPKRDLASPSAKSKSKAAARTRATVDYHPNTPEYKRWRRIWWALLGGAIVFTLVSYPFVARGGESKLAGQWVLGLGYGLIAVAFYIDWTKLRKMRDDWNKNGGAEAAAKAAEAAEKEATKTEKEAAKAAATTESNESKTPADDSADKQS